MKPLYNETLDPDPPRGRRVFGQKIYVTAVERGTRDRSPRPRSVKPLPDRIEVKLRPQENYRGRMKYYRTRSIPELCRITLTPTGENHLHREQMEEVYISQYTHRFDGKIEKPHIVAWKQGLERCHVDHKHSKLCILNSPVGSKCRDQPERPKSAPPGSFLFDFEKIDIPEPLSRRSMSPGMFLDSWMGVDETDYQVEDDSFRPLTEEKIFAQSVVPYESLDPILLNDTFDSFDKEQQDDDVTQDLTQQARSLISTLRSSVKTPDDFRKTFLQSVHIPQAMKAIPVNVSRKPLPQEPLSPEPSSQEPYQEPISQKPLSQEFLSQELLSQEPLSPKPFSQKPILKKNLSREPRLQAPLYQGPLSQESAPQEPSHQEALSRGSSPKKLLTQQTPQEETRYFQMPQEETTSFRILKGEISYFQMPQDETSYFQMPKEELTSATPKTTNERNKKKEKGLNERLLDLIGDLEPNDSPSAFKVTKAAQEINTRNTQPSITQEMQWEDSPGKTYEDGKAAQKIQMKNQPSSLVKHHDVKAVEQKDRRKKPPPVALKPLRQKAKTTYTTKPINYPSFSPIRDDENTRVLKTLVSTTSEARVDQSDGRIFKDKPVKDFVNVRKSPDSDEVVKKQQPEAEVMSRMPQTRKTKLRKDKDVSQPSAINSKTTSLSNDSLNRASSIGSEASYRRKLTSAWIEQQRLHIKNDFTEIKEQGLRRTKSADLQNEEFRMDNERKEIKLKHSKSELSFDQLQAMYDPFDEHHFDPNPNKHKPRVVHTTEPTVITKARSIEHKIHPEVTYPSSPAEPNLTPTDKYEDTRNNGPVFPRVENEAPKARKLQAVYSEQGPVQTKLTVQNNEQDFPNPKQTDSTEQQRSTLRVGNRESQEQGLRRTKSADLQNEVFTMDNERKEIKLKQSKSELNFDQQAMYDPFDERHFDPNPNKHKPRVVHTSEPTVITKARSVEHKIHPEYQGSSSSEVQNTPTQSIEDITKKIPLNLGTTDEPETVEAVYSKETQAMSKDFNKDGDFMTAKRHSKDLEILLSKEDTTTEFSNQSETSLSPLSKSQSKTSHLVSVTASAIDAIPVKHSVLPQTTDSHEEKMDVKQRKLRETKNSTSQLKSLVNSDPQHIKVESKNNINSTEMLKARYIDEQETTKVQYLSTSSDGITANDNSNFSNTLDHVIDDSLDNRNLSNHSLDNAGLDPSQNAKKDRGKIAPKKEGGIRTFLGKVKIRKSKSESNLEKEATPCENEDKYVTKDEDGDVNIVVMGKENKRISKKSSDSVADVNKEDTTQQDMNDSREHSQDISEDQKRKNPNISLSSRLYPKFKKLKNNLMKTNRGVKETDVRENTESDRGQSGPKNDQSSTSFVSAKTDVKETTEDFINSIEIQEVELENVQCEETMSEANHDDPNTSRNHLRSENQNPKFRSTNPDYNKEYKQQETEHKKSIIFSHMNGYNTSFTSKTTEVGITKNTNKVSGPHKDHEKKSKNRVAPLCSLNIIPIEDNNDTARIGENDTARIGKITKKETDCVAQTTSPLKENPDGNEQPKKIEDKSNTSIKMIPEFHASIKESTDSVTPITSLNVDRNSSDDNEYKMKKPGRIINVKIISRETQLPEDMETNAGTNHVTPITSVINHDDRNTNNNANPKPTRSTSVVTMVSSTKNEDLKTENEEGITNNAGDHDTENERLNSKNKKYGFFRAKMSSLNSTGSKPMKKNVTSDTAHNVVSENTEEKDDEISRIFSKKKDDKEKNELGVKFKGFFTKVLLFNNKDKNPKNDRNKDARVEENMHQTTKEKENTSESEKIDGEKLDGVSTKVVVTTTEWLNDHHDEKADTVNKENVTRSEPFTGVKHRVKYLQGKEESIVKTTKTQVLQSESETTTTDETESYKENQIAREANDKNTNVLVTTDTTIAQHCHKCQSEKKDENEKHFINLAPENKTTSSTIIVSIEKHTVNNSVEVSKSDILLAMVAEEPARIAPKKLRREETITKTELKENVEALDSAFDFLSSAISEDEKPSWKASGTVVERNKIETLSIENENRVNATQKENFGQGKVDSYEVEQNIVLSEKNHVRGKELPHSEREETNGSLRREKRFDRGHDGFIVDDAHEQRRFQAKKERDLEEHESGLNRNKKDKKEIDHSYKKQNDAQMNVSTTEQTKYNSVLNDTMNSSCKRSPMASEREQMEYGRIKGAIVDQEKRSTVLMQVAPVSGKVDKNKMHKLINVEQETTTTKTDIVESHEQNASERRTRQGVTAVLKNNEDEGKKHLKYVEKVIITRSQGASDVQREVRGDEEAGTTVIRSELLQKNNTRRDWDQEIRGSLDTTGNKTPITKQRARCVQREERRDVEIGTTAVTRSELIQKDNMKKKVDKILDWNLDLRERLDTTGNETSITSSIKADSDDELFQLIEDQIELDTDRKTPEESEEAGSDSTPVPEERRNIARSTMTLEGVSSQSSYNKDAGVVTIQKRNEGVLLTQEKKIDRESTQKEDLGGRIVEKTAMDDLVFQKTRLEPKMEGKERNQDVAMVGFMDIAQDKSLSLVNLKTFQEKNVAKRHVNGNYSEITQNYEFNLSYSGQSSLVKQQTMPDKCRGHNSLQHNVSQKQDYRSNPSYSSQSSVVKQQIIKTNTRTKNSSRKKKETNSQSSEDLSLRLQRLLSEDSSDPDDSSMNQDITSPMYSFSEDSEFEKHPATLSYSKPRLHNVQMDERMYRSLERPKKTTKHQTKSRNFKISPNDYSSDDEFYPTSPRENYRLHSKTL